MIIVCPKCSTRYMIPDGSIAESGRKVRCNSCGEVWTQMPTDEVEADLPVEVIDETNVDIDDVIADDFTLDVPEDEDEEDSDIEVSDIPDSIKPDSFSHNIEQVETSKRTWKDHVSGVAVAVVVLFFGTIIFLSSAESTILKHPSLRPVFAALNKDPYGMVEDVIFDHVQVEYMNDTHAFEVTGAIINLKTPKIILPLAKVTFSDEHYDVLDTGIYKLSTEPYIEGEASLGFVVSHSMDQITADKVRSVVIEFSEAEVSTKVEAHSSEINKTDDHGSHTEQTTSEHDGGHGHGDDHH